jgi:hypothetical protein
MKYFLLVYDQRNQRVLDVENYGEDGAAALARRFELDRQYAAEPAIEVVLLSAESEAALSRTHARYFKSVGELAEAAG